jgi:hypothetical protein
VRGCPSNPSRIDQPISRSSDFLGMIKRLPHNNSARAATTTTTTSTHHHPTPPLWILRRCAARAWSSASS